MSTEENKAVVRQWQEVAVSTDDLTLARTLWADDAVNRATQFLVEVRRAMPDLRLSVHDLVAEDDHVVVYFTGRGTHTGTAWGGAPTGRSIEFTEAALYQFAAGKRFPRRWNAFSGLSMIAQLGNPPGRASSSSRA